VVRARTKSGSAITLFDVIIESPQIRIAEPTDGGVTIVNEGPHLLDLSGWEVKTGKRTFTLPQDTVLPAHRSSLFSWDIMAMASSSKVELLYPHGEVASSYDGTAGTVMTDDDRAQPYYAEAGIEEVAQAPVTAAPQVAYGTHEPAAPVASSVVPDVAGAAILASGTPVILKHERGIIRSVTSWFGSLFGH
jgi:hypothetical protein